MNTKILRYAVRYGFFPVLYFGVTGSIIHLVSSGANTWLTLPFVIIFCAVMVGLGEYVQPYFVEWRPTKQELKTDVVHYAVNYGVKQGAVLLMPIVISYVSFIGTAWPTGLPFLVQVIAAGLVFDFVLYWIHRLSHRDNFFWRLHTIHHSPNKLYLVNGEKRHPLHQLVEGVPALMALILLGVPGPVIVAFLTFLNLNMMLQHANIDYRMGPLKYIIAGAETHRYHHFREVNGSRDMVNFAQVFVLWDLIFGTFHFSRPGVGLDQAGIKYLPKFPRNYTEHLRWPFSRSLRVQYFVSNEHRS